MNRNQIWTSFITILVIAALGFFYTRSTVHQVEEDYYQVIEADLNRMTGSSTEVSALAEQESVVVLDVGPAQAEGMMDLKNKLAEESQTLVLMRQDLARMQDRFSQQRLQYDSDDPSKIASIETQLQNYGIQLDQLGRSDRDVEQIGALTLNDQERMLQVQKDQIDGQIREQEMALKQVETQIMAINTQMTDVTERDRALSPLHDRQALFSRRVEDLRQQKLDLGSEFLNKSRIAKTDIVDRKLNLRSQQNEIGLQVARLREHLLTLRLQRDQLGLALAGMESEIRQLQTGIGDYQSLVKDLQARLERSQEGDSRTTGSSTSK